MNKHQSFSGMLMHQLPNCQCCQQTPRKAVPWEFNPFQLQVQRRLHTGLEDGRAQERGCDGQITWVRLFLMWCWPPARCTAQVYAIWSCCFRIAPQCMAMRCPSSGPWLSLCGTGIRVWEKESLKFWPQSISINRSWAARNEWLSPPGLPAGSGGKKLASYSGLIHVFSLWPGSFFLFWTLPCIFPATGFLFFTPWGPLFLAQLLSVLS